VISDRGSPMGGGHLTARPIDIEDPFLERWHLSNKVGGPLGSDMNAGWLGADGLYRIVASCGPYQTHIAYGEMCLFVSNDTMRTFRHQLAPRQPAPGVLHRYPWRRCTELPAQCGGHVRERIACFGLRRAVLPAVLCGCEPDVSRAS
jgi:hypothetical protein